MSDKLLRSDISVEKYSEKQLKIYLPVDANNLLEDLENILLKDFIECILESTRAKTANNLSLLITAETEEWADQIGAVIIEAAEGEPTLLYQP